MIHAHKHVRTVYVPRTLSIDLTCVSRGKMQGMDDGPVIKNGFFAAINALLTADINVSPALQIFSKAGVVSRISIQALAAM
jgi:hypothetical protein